MDCLKMNLSSDNKLPSIPFGEEQIDQRLTSFNSRYTFSAKEKDIETGYSYFGARYYTSDLSIWLSVDPLADKYPSLSPYNYCANNPIKLIDPNGEYIAGTDGKAVTYTKDAKGNIVWSKNASTDVQRVGNSMLKTSTGTKMYNNMQNAEHSINIKIDKTEQKDPNVLGLCENTYGTTRGVGDPEKIISSTITIYESNIDEKKEKDFTVDEAIGAVAGHEAVHATDKENMWTSILAYMTSGVDDFFKQMKEQKPKEIERQILNEVKQTKMTE